MFLTDKNIFFTSFEGRSVTEIPRGNWLVRNSIDRGFFLEKMPCFEMPDRIYGDVNTTTTRYLNTFQNWDKNLGILLTGMKGTGKSLLARNICIQSGLATLVVTTPYHGENFASFLNQIQQRCVVLFDEFEKVYSESEAQEGMLSILDGVLNNKHHMFILTINEESKLTSYLNNRPGRLHYRKDYDGLDNDTIIEICEDILDNTEKISEVVAACMCIGDVTMDIVVSLIKEMNLYPHESAFDAMGQMNLRSGSTSFEVTIRLNNMVLKKDMYTASNPLVDGIKLSWFGENHETIFNEDHDPEHVWNDIYISKDECDITIRKDGTIIVKCTEEDPDGVDYNWNLIYTRHTRKKTSYSTYYF